MRITLLAVVLGAAGGCVGSGYESSTVSVTATDGYYPGYVWVDGHWAWTARGWVWQPGYWVAERPGFVFVDGYWWWGTGGWMWIGPRWVHERPGHHWVRGGYHDGRYVPGRWAPGTIVRDHRDHRTYRHSGGTPPPPPRANRPRPPPPSGRMAPRHNTRVPARRGR